MNSLEFEQLLSTTPCTNKDFKRPCVRDMIYDYFKNKYRTAEAADRHTKEYTDWLYERFVR